MKNPYVYVISPKCDKECCFDDDDDDEEEDDNDNVEKTEPFRAMYSNSESCSMFSGIHENNDFVIRYQNTGIS